MFEEKIVPAESGSGWLFDIHYEPKNKGSIECLGITFSSDQERHEYFMKQLRQGLEELHAKLGGVPFTTVEEAVEQMKSVEKWPMGDDARLHELAERMREEHRKETEKDLLQLWKDQIGFPHGEIDDILSLSDPPYYTACPNPFIGDFIKHYSKPYDPDTDNYQREPSAADVSEGKNDPIYNAHSYHTKVPHKAIMRYILHYTEPGDLVFDGFCGTGMTGVAAQLCGDPRTVESLGYRVDEQGIIYQQETDIDGNIVWKPFSKLGARQAILNDLSPAATFIAYNYNTPVDVQAFEREAKRILREVEEECGWMYATLAQAEANEAEGWAEKLMSCRTADEASELIQTILNIGRINYTVWSDVFICPECTQEVVFWEAAVDKEAGKVHKEFPCPHCGAMLTKRNMERAWVTRYDKAIGETIRQAKQVPVLINYSIGKRRYEKKPDAFDLALIEKIEQLDIPYWFPTDRMPEGEESRRNDDIGLTHVHHFYTKRNLWVLGEALSRSLATNLRLGVWVTSAMTRTTKMYKYMPVLKNGQLTDRRTGTVSGTLYVPSMADENSPFELLASKIRDFTFSISRNINAGTSTNSATDVDTSNVAVDYIFTDPPFGGNLMYSELNFLWEAWLKVFTNNKPEAITNKVQGKGLPEYQRLMTECFKEYYRLLKPGRWMTVEFHNSKNSVWNAIQEAIQTAGFVIADVRTLDKKQGSFKQVTSASAVKQDLIISAYKPNGGLEERFRLTAGTEEGVWDFVRSHLAKLPVFVANKYGQAEVIAERQNYLLYDRMVAFHVQRGVTVPLSAAEFYAGLAQRFPERDGMYFLPEQVAKYDKKRMKVKDVLQLQLFVTDEASAIQWLNIQLNKKPQTFQELQPRFLKEISVWQKHEKPLELLELLGENFLRYDGKGPIPKQIVSWMKKSERLRERIRKIEVAGGETDRASLSTDDPELIKSAKDRWYVPDPNEAQDLEKLREKRLLKEFEDYKTFKGKRLKIFRLEAVRAGFKRAWQERDYATIITVARKIPGNVLQEDPKLLMWFDQALTRMGEEL